jgi:hypothetical protein
VSFPNELTALDCALLGWTSTGGFILRYPALAAQAARIIASRDVGEITILLLKLRRLWATEHAANDTLKVQPNDSERLNDTAEVRGETRRGKNIHARMLETIQEIPEAMGWSSIQWARHLKCAKSTVVGTTTWKNFTMLREQAKAKRALDRRRRVGGVSRSLRPGDHST